MRAGSPAMLVASAALQASPQAGVPWIYTGAGWVQAGAGMGQPMVMGMPGTLQPQMLPGAVVPVDQAMFSGLAAGLSGLALQDGSELVSSGQGLACMPAMLPTSPNSSLMYHSSGGAYAMQGGGMASAAQGGAALMYGSAQGGAGTSMQQQGQGQQQWHQ